MLKSITVANFRCFSSPQTLEFSPRWNVIIGRNNSGKSSILKAIRVNDDSSIPYRGISQRSSAPRDQQSIKSYIINIQGEKLKSLLYSSNQTFPVGSGNTEELLHQLSETLDSGYLIVHFSTQSSNGRKIHSVVNENGYAFRPDSGNVQIVVPHFEGAPQLVAWQGGVLPVDQFFNVIFWMFQRTSFFFDAERMNIATSNVTGQRVLAPNASNLAEVLQTLQSNRGRFDRFVRYVTEIFPEIKDVVLVSTGQQGLFQVQISTAPREYERDDLNFSLADCGTGVSQVLAILYVAIYDDEPRLIVIDEPNSFLHPGAAKQLIRILKRFTQHQFIVSTHSPEIINEISPDRLFVVRWEDSGSKVEQIDRARIEHVRGMLLEIGSAFSDVFGPDAIIFVEGPTEVECFKRVLDSDNLQLSRGVSLLPLGSPDRVTGKNKEDYFEVYEQMVKSPHLIPPALAYCRDREHFSQREMEDAKRASKGRLKFLPRRSFENYLIHPGALAAVLVDNGTPITETEVDDWIKANGLDREFFKQSGQTTAVYSSDWSKEVNAAKLLAKLFSELTDQKIFYRKVAHGVAITTWLLKNDKEHLAELLDFVRSLAQLRAN